MPNRAFDWFRQAKRDLEQARDSNQAERHERAVFAAQQSAEKVWKPCICTWARKHGAMRWQSFYASCPVACRSRRIRSTRLASLTVSTARPVIPMVIRKGPHLNIMGSCRAER